ncbi:MutT/nudix family phosphohydrolase, partial [Lacticaseibacillus rhamnosus MTCC 5462]
MALVVMAKTGPLRPRPLMLRFLTAPVRAYFLGGFPLADYIKQIRAKVDHTPLIMAGVIGVLTDEAGQVLFQQRSDFKGQWGLISGTIEYGETPAQTMIREFKEETNLTVKVVSLLGVD